MKDLLKEANRIGKHYAKMDLKPSPKRSREDSDSIGYFMENKYRNIKAVNKKSLKGHF